MTYTNYKAELILQEILSNMDQNGKYPLYEGDAGYYQEGDKFIAFDNIICDCWVEEFKTEHPSENSITMTGTPRIKRQTR